MTLACDKGPEKQGNKVQLISYIQSTGIEIEDGIVSWSREWEPVDNEVG